MDENVNNSYSADDSERRRRRRQQQQKREVATTTNTITITTTTTNTNNSNSTTTTGNEVETRRTSEDAGQVGEEVLEVEAVEDTVEVEEVEEVEEGGSGSGSDEKPAAEDKQDDEQTQGGETDEQAEQDAVEESNKEEEEGKRAAGKKVKIAKRRVVTLADVLKNQLLEQPMRTTYTQTDFSWARMALRWGNGKVMWSSKYNEGDLYRSCPLIELGKMMMDEFAERYPSVFSSLSSALIQELSGLAVHLRISRGVLDLTEIVKELMASETVSPQLKTALEPILEVQEPPTYERFVGSSELSSVKSFRSKTSRKSDSEIIQPALVSASKAMVNDTVDTQMKEFSMVPISVCNANDKCNDTSDLEFNPYDLTTV